MSRRVCSECGTAAGALAWRCGRCGGPLELEAPPFDAAAIEAGEFSLWRYAAMLPVPRRFSLGEGMTPLVPMELDGIAFQAKLEYLNPTGSFKDRGTAVMLNYLASQGAADVIDNSSGNAGASLAAYAGAAGLRATVYVPAATARASKKRLIRAFGGAIIESRNLPADIYQAAERATYASHAWHPYFLLGQQTAAWEIWEQLGGRAPAAIALPVGHGGLFLGLMRGFQALQAAGCIKTLPRLIALQTTGVDPIARAWEQNLAAPPAIAAQPSVADGILVDAPVRGKQILSALRASGGFALRLADEAILAAQAKLHKKGIMVEPTSAIAAAALPHIAERLGKSAPLILAFTGSGLKTLSPQ